MSTLANVIRASQSWNAHQTTCLRVADQLAVAVELLRQTPVTRGDLVRVRQLCQAEAKVCELLLEKLDGARPDV